MAWRPNPYVIEGELDNTTPGRVTGWVQFAGMKDRVTFDLEGNFHRDIRGAKLHIRGDGNADEAEAAQYMGGFAQHQTGQTGDITAGLEPVDYVRYPYIEWYGAVNGRVVIELDPGQAERIGQPIPAIESDPISRQEQEQNMTQFLMKMGASMGDANPDGAGGSDDKGVQS